MIWTICVLCFGVLLGGLARGYSDRFDRFCDGLQGRISLLMWRGIDDQ